MKTKIFLFAVLITATLIGFYSCKKQSQSVQPSHLTLRLPEVPYSYNDVNFTGQTNDLITLGRVLFYDTRLSVNNAISCASCHKQIIGFADNAAFSRGFENRLTTRNSIPIQNLATFSFEPDAVSLFWDGRQSFLSSMVLKPITNHVEMGMSDDNAIAERVRQTPYYADLFEKAFNGENDITATKIANAMAAFVGNISSSNAKFDQVQNGQATFSALETQGQELFFTKYNCGSCHQSVVAPIGYGSAANPAGFINIGLDENYSDRGLGAITGNVTDDGKFKVPSLRNVALTAPYMHDGRFGTLNEVLDHYSHGIANSANLDIRLKGTDNLPVNMNISEQEKVAIIAFLGTLTDYSIIHDVRFSSPFISQ